MNINIILDEGSFRPEKAYTSDAGFDLRTPKTVILDPNDSVSIDTGVHMEIPEGYVGFLKSKSGLYVKHGIQCEGVVDSGYTGSIVAKLVNHSGKTHVFNIGEKITQIVILPIPEVTLTEVTQFANTERGNGGFGSTGR